MEYKTIQDLNREIFKNLHLLPRDVDMIVGIPRSGMLAASIVALALDLPLADLQGFAEGRVLSSGTTRRRQALNIEFEDVKHALVVDDSINFGSSMENARLLLPSWPGKRLTFMAVFGVAPQQQGADLIFEVVPQPRMFEWNIMHHNKLATACIDIDGILCVDPTTKKTMTATDTSISSSTLGLFCDQRET